MASFRKELYQPSLPATRNQDNWTCFLRGDPNGPAEGSVVLAAAIMKYGGGTRVIEHRPR